LSEEITLSLKFPCTDNKFSKSVYVALLPDNLSLPSGLSIKMSLKEGSLCVTIIDSDGRIERVKQTFNDMLRCMCAVCRVLEKCTQHKDKFK